MSLTPEAQALTHSSCKHVVYWKGTPEIIVVDSSGHIAIRRDATPFEVAHVPSYELLCIK